MIAVLVTVAVAGLARDRSPATLNNVAFIFLHVAVLSRGIAPALLPALATPAYVTQSEPSEARAA